MFTFLEVLRNRSIINRVEIKAYARHGVNALLCKLSNFENKSQNFGRKMTKLLLKGTDSCSPVMAKKYSLRGFYSALLKNNFFNPRNSS